MTTTLSGIAGTTWAGSGELWMDPLGDEAARSEVTAAVESDTVQYTWSHDGKAQSGTITARGDGADFVDTFHSPETMRCRLLPDTQGLLQVQGQYGPAGEWGWRIGVSIRPTGELVLQMTNIAPWGEEGRAVRMICSR